MAEEEGLSTTRQSKRAKISPKSESAEKKASKKHQKSESVKEKRDKKRQDKPSNSHHHQATQSNKGLIGSAMTLSVVGLLNYMGGQQNDASACFSGEKNDQQILDRGMMANDYAKQLVRDDFSDANDGSYEDYGGLIDGFGGFDSDL